MVASWYVKRHGTEHDMYANPQNGKQIPVPRHLEIKESLCTLIRRQLGLGYSAGGDSTPTSAGLMMLSEGVPPACMNTNADSSPLNGLLREGYASPYYQKSNNIGLDFIIRHFYNCGSVSLKSSRFYSLVSQSIKAFQSRGLNGIDRKI